MVILRMERHSEGHQSWDIIVVQRKDDRDVKCMTKGIWKVVRSSGEVHVADAGLGLMLWNSKRPTGTQCSRHWIILIMDKCMKHLMAQGWVGALSFDSLLASFYAVFMFRFSKREILEYISILQVHTAH